MDLAAELKRVDDAEQAIATLGKAFDPVGLEALLQIVEPDPEMGEAGAGEVVASLFLLTQSMLASGCCDRQALAVHLQAWRLMLTAEPDADATATLLHGLKSVRDLYGEARAA